MKREYAIVVHLHNAQVARSLPLMDMCSLQDKLVKSLRFKLESEATSIKYLQVQIGRKFR